MGPAQSKSLVKQGWTQKFGRVEVLIPEQTPSLKQFRVVLDLPHTKLNFSTWQALIRQLQGDTNINKYLILPFDWQKTSCSLCNNSNRTNTIKIFYPFFSCSLSQQIKSRRDINKYFTQQQLWYLLYVLVKVAAYFQNKGSYVGNIHPSNVLLHQSKIYLFATISSPNQPLNIERIRESKYEDAFIAPQQISQIKQQSSQMHKNLNQNKIDAFNIGLTMLSSLIFKDWYEVYDRVQFSINTQSLTSTIDSLSQQQKYSSALRRCIINLLNIDQNTRQTPKDYLCMLQPFERAILELQVFPSQSLLNSDCLLLKPHKQTEAKFRYLSLSNKKKSLTQKSKTDEAKIDKHTPETTVIRKLFIEKQSINYKN